MKYFTTLPLSLGSNACKDMYTAFVSLQVELFFCSFSFQFLCETISPGSPDVQTPQPTWLASVYTTTCCGMEYSNNKRYSMFTMFDLQNTSSSITLLSPFSLYWWSQCTLFSISKCRNLVLSWEIVPTTGPSDTILPVTDANFRALTEGNCGLYIAYSMQYILNSPVCYHKRA